MLLDMLQLFFFFLVIAALKPRADMEVDVDGKKINRRTPKHATHPKNIHKGDQV